MGADSDGPAVSPSARDGGSPPFHDATSLNLAMSALLDRHPAAMVAAIDADGLFREVPPSVPLDGHRVLAARSALDLVQPTDRYTIIDLWAATKTHGAGRAQVHLVGSDPPVPATLHVFDVRQVHGVFVGVLVADDGASPLVFDGLADIEPPPPRLARTRKSELAVIEAVDSAVTEMLGWSPDKLVGASSLDFIHPDDHERAIDLWMECLSRPGHTCRTRLRHRRRDGRWLWIEMSNTNLLDEPDAGYVDCEMIDISDEMEAHEAVRSSEQLLRRVAAAIPVGVAQFDLSGRILYANERLYEIVGAPPDADEESLLACVVDRRALAEGVAELRSGTDIDLELTVERADGGGRRHCTMALRTLTNDDGEVIGGVFCLNDITDEARMRTELERRATLDELTGCVNRRTVLSRLREATADVSLSGGTAVAFVDLDEFKAVNDHHGHAVGDALLVEIGARLRSTVRAGDVVGRLGGDEFLVVWPDVADEGTAESLGERLSAILHEPVAVAGVRLEVRASIGLAWVPAGSAADPDALVAQADARMYRVKRDRAAGA